MLFRSAPPGADIHDRLTPGAALGGATMGVECAASAWVGVSCELAGDGRAKVRYNDRRQVAVVLMTYGDMESFNSLGFRHFGWTGLR